MLSPITSTVTVAPLTISTCGAGDGAAHDGIHVRANQLIDGVENALHRNSHEHDGFLVLDKLETGDHPFRTNADQELDRLSGVAGGVGKVGVQVNEAEELAILEAGAIAGSPCSGPKRFAPVTSSAGSAFAR